MKSKTLLMLVVLYGSAFVAGYNENLVNMSLVSIMADFEIDAITVNWLVTGYMIVATIVVTSMAFLYRRFKLRQLFFAASTLSVAGSVIGLLSPTFAVLLIARLVQAVGTGIFIPLMMNTILAVAPKNRMSTYLSIGSCMITFGPALAPVVCGALTTIVGWHAVFVVPIVATCVFMAIGVFVLYNLDTPGAHLDAMSLLLISVVIFALSYGLAELTVNLALALFALVIMLACGALFFWRQERCAHPLLDLAPLKNRGFRPTLVLTMIGMMSTFSLSVLLPMYFESACGMTALMAGFTMLIPVLVNAATTVLGGRIMDKSGEWPLLPAGFLLLTLGFIALAIFSPASELLPVFCVLIVLYAAVGFIMSPSQSAGLKRLPRDQNPFGVALSTTCIQIAACIGPALYTGVMSGVQGVCMASGDAAGPALAGGISAAMTVAAVIAAVGIEVSFLYARKCRVTQRAAQADAVNTSLMVADSDYAVQTPTGSSALTIANIMIANPYVLAADASVREVISLMVQKRIGGVPLVDAQMSPAGFVSDGDIMRYLADKHPIITNAYSLVQMDGQSDFDERLQELLTHPASEIATAKTITIDIAGTIEDACNMLAKTRLKKVPVIDSGRIVGAVNRSDILRFALDKIIA